MPGTQKNRIYTPKWIGSFGLLLFTLVCSINPSAQAAEYLNLKIGLLQKSITTEELEHFAQTGEFSPNLQPYGVVLTPEVQKMLQLQLHVEPHLAAQFLEDLFESPDGKKLLKQIKTALPETNRQGVQTALNQAVQAPNNLNLINFLRFYPAQTLTVDLQATAMMATQMSSANLQSQILSPQLASTLKVETPLHLSSQLNPVILGQEKVFQETRILQDNQRKRSLTVDIYYSVQSQGPLVIMSHGFAADRRFLRYLAYHLASYGVTVVSVEHPGSNINYLVKQSQALKLSQILPATEFIERPKDITFVLNELARLNQSSSYLKDKFNTQKVTIIGHSFGGYTALAVAGATLDLKQLRRYCQELELLGRSPADWLQCATAQLPYSQLQFRDSRIVQVIAFNPIIGHLFNQSLNQVTVPTLILASSEDGITPNIAHQLQPFQQLGGEKYLLVAVGATHMSVTDLIYLNSALGQSTLVREVMDETANPVRKMAMGVSLAFIEQLTPQAAEYQPFLTSAYVQSLSSNCISLRLTKYLPLSLEATLTVLALSHNKITHRNAQPKPSLFSSIKSSINHVNWVFSRPQYHAGRLEKIFQGLLKTYRQNPGELS
jgi:predicted dienelactone hydrolase